MYAYLNRRKNVYLPIFTKNLHIIITHLSIQITVVIFPLFYGKTTSSILYWEKTTILLVCRVVSGWVQRWWIYHILGFRKYKISHIQEMHQEVFALQCHHVHWWLSRAMLCFLCCILIKPIDQSKIKASTREPWVINLNIVLTIKFHSYFYLWKDRKTVQKLNF